MDDLTSLAYLTVTTEVRPRQVSQCGANTAGMRRMMYAVQYNYRTLRESNFNTVIQPTYSVACDED